MKAQRIIQATVAALSLAIATSPLAVAADKTLIVEASCPASGRNAACIRMAFDVPKDARREGDGWTFEVTARQEGGRSKGYDLHVGPYDVVASEMQSIPYLGRSPSNHPIILTDKGRLEVESANFDTLKNPAIVVVDDRLRQIRARYLMAWPNPAYTSTSAGVELWLLRDGVCISAPQYKAGLLKISSSKCKTAIVDTTKTNMFGLPLSFAPVAISRAQLERLGSEFVFDSEFPPRHRKLTEITFDGYEIAVRRFPNSRFLVISMGCTDCS